MFERATKIMVEIYLFRGASTVDCSKILFLLHSSKKYANAPKTTTMTTSAFAFDGNSFITKNI